MKIKIDEVNEKSLIKLFSDRGYEVKVVFNEHVCEDRHVVKYGMFEFSLNDKCFLTSTLSSVRSTPYSTLEGMLVDNAGIEFIVKNGYGNNLYYSCK